MAGKAAKVVITERQQDVLQKLARATTIAVRLQQRAQIILLAFEGKLNQEIESLVGLGRDQVGGSGDSDRRKTPNGSRLLKAWNHPPL